jgi:ribokinase
MARLVVIGSCNTDLVVQAPRLPKPGESVLGGVFAKFPGGKGANQAVAAARMGAEVTFVARVGEDDFGREALENFRREGIETSHIALDPKEATGIALIAVDAGGENQIVVAMGANGELSPEQVDAAAEAIDSCQVVLAQLEMPMETVERVAEIAARCEKPFVLNPAPACPLPGPVLEAVDVLTPNLGELGIIAAAPVDTVEDIEKAAHSLLAKGVGAVVVTQGREGCTVITPEESWWSAAISVDPRDSVGAGDCFSANLAVALAEDLSLKEAVRFATVAAGLSVTRLGAQSGMPTREDVEDYLRELQS